MPLPKNSPASTIHGAACEPIAATGSTALRSRIGKYPSWYCITWPISCAATATAATDGEPYTCSDRPTMPVLGSKWSVSMPDTCVSSTPLSCCVNSSRATWLAGMPLSVGISAYRANVRCTLPCASMDTTMTSSNKIK